MNIKITARKFKAHDSLKDYIKAELHLLEKYSDDLLSADVILSYQNNLNSLKTAEIILKIPHQVLKAKVETEDFKKSVSAAVEKLRAQLNTVKSKRVNKAR
jgi:putative sigma-54 modulation protein